MRQLIAAMNMSLDGYCDHTADFYADEELHAHYADLIQNTGLLLYGRTTYELMLYWKNLLENPAAEASMNAFAHAIDGVEKLVFSRSLQATGWSSARLAENSLEEEVKRLKKTAGPPILVGSRSLIVQLLKLHLIDELQLCIHPVVVGKGLPMFDALTNPYFFKRIGSKNLQSGAVVFYYQPESRHTL